VIPSVAAHGERKQLTHDQRTTKANPSMLSRRLTRSIAIGATAIAIAGSGYGILGATASTGTVAATPAPSASAASGQPVSGSGGSNARSGPAAGGSIGKVSSVSTSGFVLSTSAGEKVTVKERSSTTYKKGTRSAPASAVTKGKTALVVGTVDGTTITATQVIVQPTSGASKTSKVIPFKPGTSSATKKVGQIPANYTEGSGTIVSGTTAHKATKAALAAYAGGIVDRVVRLSNGEYEVHNIAVNWPHHIFVDMDFKVVGAY
jgi:membrane-bound inhibitor of C-type lysozyme